ncbi:hypothetical protein [Bdellovibrio sp. HCB2-146]|uniref:hypothetical protein n=1 Tax=Bdellovibrio sp. HCB2-146 TaxID=3394362 RepID=UPI0039BC3A2D
MLRSGRFRHRLLDDDFLQQKSSSAHQCLSPFFVLWQQGRLSDAEISAVYFTVFSFLRRPQDFLGGPHNEFALLETSSDFSCRIFVDILKPLLPSDLRNSKSLGRFESETAFLPFVCAHSFRSIPISVLRSLAAWNTGQYPLKLWTTIPSPEEVLVLQTQGQRCVTMFIKTEEMAELVSDGRDAFGFLVHDLIHADHFFLDPAKAQAQIQFSQKLLVLWESPFMQELLQKDAVLLGEFHYLMSDMNSVPLHLMKTLKALLLGHIKRSANIGLASALPEQLEAHFRALFNQALSPWNFSDSAVHAAHRLNTVHFQHPDDSYILHQEMTTS